jgi:hypothetical protein
MRIREEIVCGIRDKMKPQSEEVRVREKVVCGIREKLKSQAETVLPVSQSEEVERETEAESQ